MISTVLSLMVNSYLMPEAGFEPVHGYPYSDLNAARLPVPPLGQATILFYTKHTNLQSQFLYNVASNQI